MSKYIDRLINDILGEGYGFANVGGMYPKDDKDESAQIRQYAAKMLKHVFEPSAPYEGENLASVAEKR